MSKRFSERILEYLRRPEYQPAKARKLAIAMGIAEEEFGDFHDAVDSLKRVGRIVLGDAGAVMLPHPTNQITGTFRANPRGFGFVVPDEPTAHGDLFIPPGDSLDAVTGDRVLCTMSSRGMREGKPSFGGRIIKVLERGEGKFVGKLQHEGGLWFVRTDGNTLHVPILIGDPTAKSAKAGDQVVVEIVSYPSEGRPAKGVIVERLGRQGQPGVDVQSIIRQFQLEVEFPESALAEVRAAVKAFQPDQKSGKREDLTGRTIITIDPDDAKDFDDAISLEWQPSPRPSPQGRGRADSSRPSPTGRGSVWELGVHIADVSSFVTEGGELDTAARERGTSVYLPRHVIPMLPEALSNGLCSLQEDEPRFCKSAFIRYSDDGEVLGARFANTVIRSKKRLTYRQAQAVIDGERTKLSRDVLELLHNMNKLARAIQRRRIGQGMVSLELPEVELVLDEHGKVIDARPEDTSFTHTIIEMFMVEANEAVARLLHGLSVPFIRRIHPDPSPEGLESLGRFLRAAGYSVPKKITPGDLQSILAPLKGKPEAYAVNLAVLKSLSLAEYSPKNVGHFALASKCYAHFTSPIRRYADLTVHRLLDRYLNRSATARERREKSPGEDVGRTRGESEGRSESLRRTAASAVGRPAALPHGRGSDRARVFDDAPSNEELTELANHLSYVSRRAESAENELKTIKVLELLSSQHLGDEFDGVVTGIANFGLFVQHPKYLIDGVVRIEDLGDDWWDVDAASGRIVGQRTRQAFMLGVLLRVRIAEIDLPARQMKLELVSVRGRSGRRLAPGRVGIVAGRRGGKGKPHRKGGRNEVKRGKGFGKRRGRR